MDKTLKVEIEDLIEYLKDQIWQCEESYNVYGTDRETTYLSGINEGIDRAYRVLADLNIKGYIKHEADK